MHRQKLWIATLLIVGCSGESRVDQSATSERMSPLSEGPPVAHSDQLKTLPKGEWLYKDRSVECDGYLVRTESDDFCAATVPEDWKSFEFNDQTYFVQPLS